ncbi:hypothetical protein VNO77_04806 [Canavalia gladiata]|uniref:Transmembrane protein n=1 Tax=Canavalia gladiata TaxID=3824 RepID=A0AAN9MXX6_CANGL
MLVAWCKFDSRLRILLVQDISVTKVSMLGGCGFVSCSFICVFLIGVVALGVGTVFGTYLRGLEAGMHESEALLWFCNDGLNALVNCAVSKWSRVSLGLSA